MFQDQQKDWGRDQQKDWGQDQQKDWGQDQEDALVGSGMGI